MSPVKYGQDEEWSNSVTNVKKDFDGQTNVTQIKKIYYFTL